MPTSFEVTSQIRSYQVLIGAGLFDDLLDRRRGDVILCDDYFSAMVQGRARSVIAVPASEDAKSLDHIVPVIERLREAGCNRQSSIVAIGGGVIQDIGTFCASIYMRGISWRYAPTTLLGMVDSCIGGKSAINVGKYKNIVGNFYPPHEIVIDPAVAGTLSTDQKIAGLCEAAKICFAGGKGEFERYLALSPGRDMSLAALQQVIELSLATKKVIIEIDEFDQKERLLLNFGHTFGHAIEGAAGYSISHGVAVGLGILGAVHFSLRAGLVKELPGATKGLVQHVQGLVRQVPRLGDNCRAMDPAQAFDRFLSDKKHKSASITLILPGPNGALECREFPRSDTVLQHVLETFRYIGAWTSGSPRSLSHGIGAC